MEVQPSSEGPSDILRGITYAIIISLIDSADIADTSDTADTSDVSKEKQVDSERPLRKSIIYQFFPSAVTVIFLFINFLPSASH